MSEAELAVERARSQMTAARTKMRAAHTNAARLYARYNAEENDDASATLGQAWEGAVEAAALATRHYNGTVLRLNNAKLAAAGAA